MPAFADNSKACFLNNEQCYGAALNFLSSRCFGKNWRRGMSGIIIIHQLHSELCTLNTDYTPSVGSADHPPRTAHHCVMHWGGITPTSRLAPDSSGGGEPDGCWNGQSSPPRRGGTQCRGGIPPQSGPTKLKISWVMLGEGDHRRWWRGYSQSAVFRVQSSVDE